MAGKSKRRSNTHRKEFRGKCWNRSRERKAARREAQDAAAKRNREAGTSPWREAKRARRAAHR